MSYRSLSIVLAFTNVDEARLGVSDEEFHAGTTSLVLGYQEEVGDNTSGRQVLDLFELLDLGALSDVRNPTELVLLRL